MGNRDFIVDSIFRDMSEGIIALDMNGIITLANPAALKVLEKDDDLIGMPFGVVFFEYEENDRFNQTILDAIYNRESSQESLVDYFTGEKTKQLHITTSYLKNGNEKIGVIAVLSDVTEIAELRDALKAMEQIKALNGKLELRNKLLSETFGRFLSDDIVKQLLDTPDGLKLGGKKAELTIMMSDLRGFTALSERMPAADLLTMLNHYLAEMTEIIQKHNGTIIEFIGDGIMALFGAPIFYENHAENCVEAAVEMQSRMVSINEWNEAHNYPQIEMGIGINTGDVIVGNIGSEKRTKYGVTGSNVNLAGRIESYTVGGQVLVNETTLARINKNVEVDSATEVKPKGVDKPITLSSIVEIGELNCRRNRGAMAVLTNPAEVSFFSISGKHIANESLKGKFIALSQSEAIFITKEDVKVFDNLQFEIEGEKLFGKVIGKSDEKYKIRFTSIPENFTKWLEKQN